MADFNQKLHDSRLGCASHDTFQTPRARHRTIAAPTVKDFFLHSKEIFLAIPTDPV
jgi:hypothetical protein